MGKLYCLMGKSASGKDSIYTRLKQLCPGLRAYVLYTTRPMREGEADGISYHFTDKAAIDAYEAEGKLIEERTYHTVHGDWTYATVDDGQLDLKSYDYIMPATLESYEKLRAYFGMTDVVPVYIDLDDGERLLRAVKREMCEKEPKYRELCRRFIADSEDFSEEHLKQAGIDRRFVNDDVDRCTAEIAAYIAGQQ